MSQWLYKTRKCKGAQRNAVSPPKTYSSGRSPPQMSRRRRGTFAITLYAYCAEHQLTADNHSYTFLGSMKDSFSSFMMYDARGRQPWTEAKT